MSTSKETRDHDPGAVAVTLANDTPSVDDRTPQDDGPAPINGTPFSQDTTERNSRIAKGIRRSDGRSRRWLSWLLVLAMVAGAVYGGFVIAGYRILGQSKVDLGTVVLVATPVAVGAPGPGEVTKVFVHAQQHVGKGQEIATVLVNSTDSQGLPVTTSMTLKAPLGGVVSAVAASQGTTVRVGDPVVNLYDPSSDHFEVALDTSTLQKLSTGMKVTLTGPAYGKPITAVVDQLAPRPDMSPFSDDHRLMLQLRAEHPEQIHDLVPGLLFNATAHTDTAPPGAPKSVRVAS